MNLTLVSVNIILGAASIFTLATIVLYVTFNVNKLTVLSGTHDYDDDAAIDKMCGFDQYPVKSDNGQGELRWFGAIFRHGDRTPIYYLDSDPYKDFVWPEGKHMLTNNGRRRMYCYGAVLRRRYKNYLKHIHTKNVAARSSWYRRCIETTELVLSGLFPPSRLESWAPNVKLGQYWQTIGVESTEFDRSWMLCGEAKCPKAEAIKRPDPVFAEKEKQFLEKVIKLTNGEIGGWLDLALLKDTLLIEKEYFGDDFLEPSWIKEAGSDSWDMMKRIYDVVFAAYGARPEYLRLRTGVFMNQIHEIFLNVTATSPEQERQVHMFGSHDTIVTWLMQVLDLYFGTADFGSGIIFEVRKIGDLKDPIIRLLYANNVQNFNITELNLSNSKHFAQICDVTCKGADFFKILNDRKMLIKDIEAECRLP